MEQQFPHLTHLDLIGMPGPDTDNVPYISLGRFLGGFMPSLQHLRVDDFEYEGLPSLLSSAPNLISLQIDCIRLTSYISPEVMVGALAGLTELRDLGIGFSTGFPTYLFDDETTRQSPHSPPLDRVMFLALTKFQFGGDSKYLEDLMALVDAPRLEDLCVVYVKNYDDFDMEGNIEARNLSQFINRTSTFKHAQFRHAKVTLDPHTTRVEFDLPQGECQKARVSLTVLDEGLDEDNPRHSLATAPDAIHILSQLAIMLSDVQHLAIKGIGSQAREEGILAIGGLGIFWFPLLHTFPAVDVLRVSWILAGSIALAINEEAPENMVTQVLPALQTLWLDNQVAIRKGKLLASIKQFLRCRKRSGRPVVIVNSHDQLVKRCSPH